VIRGMGKNVNNNVHIVHRKWMFKWQESGCPVFYWGRYTAFNFNLSRAIAFPKQCFPKNRSVEKIKFDRRDPEYMSFT